MFEYEELNSVRNVYVPLHALFCSPLHSSFSLGLVSFVCNFHSKCCRFVESFFFLGWSPSPIHTNALLILPSIFFIISHSDIYSWYSCSHRSSSSFFALLVFIRGIISYSFWTKKITHISFWHKQSPVYYTYVTPKNYINILLVNCHSNHKKESEKNQFTKSKRKVEEDRFEWVEWVWEHGTCWRTSRKKDCHEQRKMLKLMPPKISIVTKYTRAKACIPYQIHPHTQASHAFVTINWFGGGNAETLSLRYRKYDIVQNYKSIESLRQVLLSFFGVLSLSLPISSRNCFYDKRWFTNQLSATRIRSDNPIL